LIGFPSKIPEQLHGIGAQGATYCNSSNAVSQVSRAGLLTNTGEISRCDKSGNIPDRGEGI
jgi:hypothetical protein